MGFFSDIKNKITGYFKKRKTEKEVRKAKNDETIPKEERNDWRFARRYKAAMKETDRMSDEDAIRNYKEKRKEYDKQKEIYDKAEMILKKYKLGMTGMFMIYDEDLKIAEYILKIKGLNETEIDLDEIEVSSEEVKEKVITEINGIIGQMEYYQQPMERMNRIKELGEKILREEFGDDGGEPPKEIEDLIK